MRAGEYWYETHMHTKEASACAGSTGEEMARAYAAAGYTGIIITDHFFYGNTAVDRSLPWEEWVEPGYQGTEFLIYGPDKKWLLEHPQIRDATIPEQFELVHQGGGIVVHAHPFREASYISEIRLFPEYVDGVEGVNATHSSTRKTIPLHPEYNECAINYAREHGLPLTGGSDQHNTEMIMGGMVFARKLIDIRDFAGAVIAGEAVRIPDGTQEA